MAVTTPSTALSGTAMAATDRVSQKALMAAGVVTLSNTAASPGSKVL